MFKNKKCMIPLLVIALVFGCIAYFGFSAADAKALPDGFVSAKAWHFDTPGDREGWEQTNDATVDISDGCMNGSVWGLDPYIFSHGDLNLEVGNNNAVVVRLRNNTSSDRAEFYFITNAEPDFDDIKRIVFQIEPNSDFKEYVLDMTTNPHWTGTINRVRIDPSNDASEGSFSIDYIEIGYLPSIGTPTEEPTPEPTETPDNDNEDDEDEDIDDQDDQDNQDDEDNDKVPQTGQDYTLPITFAVFALLISVAAVVLGLKPRKQE